MKPSMADNRRMLYANIFAVFMTAGFAAIDSEARWFVYVIWYFFNVVVGVQASIEYEGKKYLADQYAKSKEAR